MKREYLTPQRGFICGAFNAFCDRRAWVDEGQTVPDGMKTDMVRKVA